MLTSILGIMFSLLLIFVRNLARQWSRGKRTRPDRIDYQCFHFPFQISNLRRINWSSYSTLEIISWILSSNHYEVTRECRSKSNCYFFLSPIYCGHALESRFWWDGTPSQVARISNPRFKLGTALSTPVWRSRTFQRVFIISTLNFCPVSPIFSFLLHNLYNLVAYPFLPSISFLQRGMYYLYKIYT